MAKNILINECGEPLVNLENFDFLLEPVYFKQGFSEDNRMFLRKSVAQKLLNIQKELGVFRFKIFDGFRPREVQRNLYMTTWNDIKSKHPEWTEGDIKKEVECFVFNFASENPIPPHATGGTIDLTLVDSKGVELDMGTKFDHFGPEASSMYYEENQINETVRQNRKILREAMIKESFSLNKNEWWHYDFGNQVWAENLGKQEAIFGEQALPTK